MTLVRLDMQQRVDMLGRAATMQEKASLLGRATPQEKSAVFGRTFSQVQR